MTKQKLMWRMFASLDHGRAMPGLYHGRAMLCLVRASIRWAIM